MNGEGRGVRGEGRERKTKFSRDPQGSAGTSFVCHGMPCGGMRLMCKD